MLKVRTVQRGARICGHNHVVKAIAGTLACRTYLRPTLASEATSQHSAIGPSGAQILTFRCLDDRYILLSRTLWKRGSR